METQAQVIHKRTGRLENAVYTREGEVAVRKTDRVLLLGEWLRSLTKLFEANRFGAMTIMLTFQSCLGSVAAYYATINHAELGVILAASATMSSNAAFIAQSPAAWCVRIFALSLLINMLVIAFNIL